MVTETRSLQAKQSRIRAKTLKPKLLRTAKSAVHDMFQTEAYASVQAAMYSPSF